MAYPTVEEIKTFILESTGVTATLDDSIIELSIDAFVHSLELAVGMSFVPVTEERRFDGMGGQRLIVDPYRTITSIEFDVVSGTPYTVDLADLIFVERVMRPKMEIQFKHGFLTGIANGILLQTRFTAFPSGNSNVIINGEWGWFDDVPADIVFALKMYSLVLQNQLKPDFIDQLKPFTVKEVEETDRRMVFQLLSPDKFLPKHITWSALVNRYSSIRRAKKATFSRKMIV